MEFARRWRYTICIFYFIHFSSLDTPTRYEKKIEKKYTSKAKTNKNGIATISHRDNDRDINTLIVRNGADMAFLENVKPIITSYKSTTVWHIFDDRGIYKPKEHINIKGYFRLLTRSENQNRAVPLMPPLQKLQYKFEDARGVQFHDGDVYTSGFGSFYFDMTLPEDINLGNCTLRIKQSSRSWASPDNCEHQFQVEEFRATEFVAKASEYKQLATYYGGEKVIKCEASYYAGGALGESGVHWKVINFLFYFSDDS